MRNPTILLVLLLASLCLASTALAQVGAVPAGPIGVRAGDLEFHPALAAEVGYDSNFFQGSGATCVRGASPNGLCVDEPVVSSARLRLTPSVAVNTMYKSARSPEVAPPRFDLSGKITGHFDQLWALSGEFGPGKSSKTLWPPDGDLNLLLDILPKRVWGGGIGLTVARINQPANNPALSGTAFARWVNGASLELRYRPGMGNLEWSLGYAPRITLFDESAYKLDVLEQSIQTKGRWLFLPRTALLYQAETRFVNYLNQGTHQVNSTPLSGLFGASGLITPKLGLTLMAGWKGTFFDAGSNIKDLDAPIGRAELAWYFTGGNSSPSALRIGYERGADISAIANYYELNRVQADLTLVLGQNFNLLAHAGVVWIRHPRPVSQLGGCPANPNSPACDLRYVEDRGRGEDMYEIRPEAQLFGEYHLTRNISITSNNQFSASPRHNRIELNPDRADGVQVYYDDLRFFRFVTMLGVAWAL